MTFGISGTTIATMIAAPVIGSAVGGLLGGGSRGSSPSAGAQQGAAAADPFGSQRPQYQQMLSDLMTGKKPYEETAGARFATQTGLDAQSAQMASRGLSSSGAEKAALTKYATGVASQDYNTHMANLMQMAGTGAGSTGTAGSLLSNSSDANQNALDTFGSSIGKAVTGSDRFKGLFDGNSGAAPGGMVDMTGFQTPATSPWASGGGSSVGTNFSLNF